MLFRKHIVSTRTLFQVAAAAVFSLVAVGVASAANSGVAPLLVPYTIQTIAGTPQYPAGTTALATGYYGEGAPATSSLATYAASKATAVLNGPYAMAVDSVGNVYIADTSNYIIREVNAQSGLITTVAGVVPKGCAGVTCTLRTSGCADGVPAVGNPIGSKIEGIAVDGYDNVYFADYTTTSVSVIYRGGTQVANFIKLEDPAGVAGSPGGVVTPGYVYHVAGAVNLTTCSPTKGNADNNLAFTNTANGVAAADIATPAQVMLISLDSAGNLYIADTGNLTTRVVNTQATAQTFFQYTVQPGYMRSIMGCNALLTAACPTAPTTSLLNTNINGPANALVYNSQLKSTQVDAYGNLYEVNGTGNPAPAFGYYGPVAYAGGAPLTNLIQAETPLYQSTYGPLSANPVSPPGTIAALNSAGLPTYGNAYPIIGNPSLSSTLQTNPDLLVPLDGGGFYIRPSSLNADNFGTLWFLDNHYPEFSRIDQYTSLETILVKTGRSTGGTYAAKYNQPASFSYPWYCVYGSSGTPWTQGPQTYDPEGDGCPSVVAESSGYYQSTFDGLGDVYLGDGPENLERELVNGNVFPPTPVGTATPVIQPIQVHFNSSNPPAIVSGVSVPDAADTGVVTSSFSIAPGISDFTINTTTPEFPMGSLINGSNSAYGNTTSTANFQMWAGLPTCTQLGIYPKNTGVTDYDCLVYVAFNPTAPGVRQSQLLITTNNGSKYSFQLNGIGTGGQLAIDGGTPAPVSVAGLKSASAVAVNSAGTLYIADTTNNAIVVQPAGGSASNLTFTGVTPATLNKPMGVALDSANNVYISDTGNNRILKVNPLTNVAAVLGNYVWISGSLCDGKAPTSPTCPSVGLGAEPGANTSATTAPPQYAFNAPQGLAVDVWNNVYVADTGNKTIVMIPSNLQMGGAIPLLSYPGAPTFSKPVAVAVDSLGNVYVADNGIAGGVIVKLPPGSGDLVSLPGPVFPNTLPSNGLLLSPNGVAVDAAGDVYVSDNATSQIVEIPTATGASGTPFLLNFPSVNAPGGLALDSNGNLYVADSGNKQVVFSNRQNPIVNFGTVPQDLSVPSGIAGYIGTPPAPAPCPVAGVAIPCTGVLTVTNIGSSSLSLAAPFVVGTGTVNPAYNLSSTCPNSLPAGATCTISPTFNPTADNLQSETVSVNGGTQSLSLVANGEQPLAKIVLTSSLGTTPAAGGTATITATVTQPFITGNTPTGTVTFVYTIDASNNNLNSCGSGGTQTVNLVNGIASFQLPVLAQGVQYTVNATYSGDTFNSYTVASKLDVFVQGISVTSTVTSTATQLTYTYGGTPPVPVGTVTPAPASPITYTYGSLASNSSPVAGSPYPVIVTFHGAGSCAYGFPTSVFSTGGTAVIIEKPAPLTYTLPNFTSLYGAPDLSYGAGITAVGAVNGDTFSATFVPASSSILNVGTYHVVATVIGHNAANYIVTTPQDTLTITPAPVAIGITAAKTQVLNNAAGVAAATYGISVSSTVPSGKGVPSGTVTVIDNFTPITATGTGTAAAPTTTVVPLVAGYGTYIPTSLVAGIHQYSFTYSGDSNFQTASLVPSATAAACTPAAPAANCLIVDNPDFTLTSIASTILVNPGTIPSGNGLPIAVNQSTAYPESAVLFVNAILGFNGSVSISCATQNPSYVTCFMTPASVCFAATSSAACTNIGTTAATVLAVETPTNLPLGFFGQTRTSATKTVLAFLPFGVLAFCVRRRRRLSKALWMLIMVAGISAVMSGCGGNQVAFYTPIPTGPQTVTVTATYNYNSNVSTQPAAVRTFVVPIAIE